MKTAKERTKLFEEISRYAHYFDCNSAVAVKKTLPFPLPSVPFVRRAMPVPLPSVRSVPRYRTG